MSHHHPTTTAHSVEQSLQRKLTNYFFTQLHDTELWANYLPHIPSGLIWLAGLGAVVFGIGVFQSAWSLLSGVALGLGLVLIVPLIAVGVFAVWKWNRRIKLRNQILDSITWRGDERVLDVGCGNGLLLNGAAKRLTTGQALGIDLWVAHGGGGTEAMLWQNARFEKVADKIEFKQVDARQMPFETGSFDVVVSSGAIHHISRTRADFEQVVNEMFRVLKPGGQIVISDTEHMVQACASRMPAAGIDCQVQSLGKFLGFEMALVSGRRTG